MRTTPLRRIVSEYYWAEGIQAQRSWQANDANRFNGWVQRQLLLVKAKGHCMQGHCIPSNQYTHDGGKQVVDHILKLENITELLPALLARYGLGRIELGRSAARSRTSDDSLDARNFTRETLCMVNDWARLDFYYYGYEMIVPPDVTDGSLGLGIYTLC